MLRRRQLESAKIIPKEAYLLPKPELLALAFILRDLEFLLPWQIKHRLQDGQYALDPTWVPSAPSG